MLLAGPAPAQLAVEGEPVVAYSRDPETVVLSLTEEIGELEEADKGPSVTVYGDGRVLVHYPIYMKRAGDWETRLSDAELDALLASVGGKLVPFDAQVARAGLAQARSAQASQQQATQSGTYRSDPTETRIRLRLQSFRAGPAAPDELRDVDRDIRWRGLRRDARKFTGVREVQDLATARSELRALMTRPDLTKVD